jgi:hypothetical protein
MTLTTTRKDGKEEAAALRIRVVDFWDGMLGLVEAELQARRQVGKPVDESFARAAKIVSDQIRLDITAAGQVSGHAADPGDQPPRPRSLDDIKLKIA